MNVSLEQAQAHLQAHVPAGSRWLAEARGADLAVAFASAGRRLGRSPLPPLGELRFDADELGRALLLWSAPDADRLARASDAFYKGDNRERQAVLKALPLFPEPERYVPLATEGCRLNVVPVFEAIACENPFPRDHFSEAQFNQLALKAVFLGVRVSRILGLPGRKGPELSRMASDYAAERTAAGRAVPEDLRLLT